MNRIKNKDTFYKVLYVTTLSLTLATGLMLFGCEKSFTHEPWDYQVKTMEAEFNGDVVLDTTTMEDINDYLSTAEVMTNVEPKEIADSQTMLMVFITEDAEKLKIGGVHMRYDGEEGLTGRVHVDGEAIGYLDPETYEGLKESFDADSYVQEN